MADELNWKSAAKLVRGYARKKFSPVEAARACLARIARHDKAINAMCRIDEAKALAQARASERRWMKGRALSALDGVPTLIKDLLLVKGWPTLRGSRTVDPNQAWNDDAPFVSVGGKYHGRMRSGSYIAVTVPEGEVKVSVQQSLFLLVPTIPRSVTVEVVAGGSSYVRVDQVISGTDMSNGVTVNQSVVIEEVSPEVGQAELEKARKNL